MFEAQTEERRDALPGAAAPIRAQQNFAVRFGVDNGRIAGGINSRRDTGVDLSKRDLVTKQNRGFDTGAAGALQIEARGLRIETGRQHAFARQIEIFGMFEYRAGHDIAESLVLQMELVNDATQGLRQHVLIAHLGVGALRARERDASSTDNGDAARTGSD